MTKKKQKGNPPDPHAAREAAKYDNPIPSREFILELLQDAEQPLKHGRIAEQLKLDGEEALDALRRRLRAMERDGQLMVNRRGAYGLVDKMDLIHGRVQGHRDGYGFLIPVDGSDEATSRQMDAVVQS